MPNPLRGEAAFQAGERELTLTFDVNVFCEIEMATGLGLTGLMDKIQGDPSLGLMRHIFCAALQPKQPGTTLVETGEIMSDAGIEGITVALQSAVQQAMPGAKEGGANPRRRAAKRT